MRDASGVPKPALDAAGKPVPFKIRVLRTSGAKPVPFKDQSFPQPVKPVPSSPFFIRLGGPKGPLNTVARSSDQERSSSRLIRLHLLQGKPDLKAGTPGL